MSHVKSLSLVLTLLLVYSLTTTYFVKLEKESKIASALRDKTAIDWHDFSAFQLSFYKLDKNIV